MLKTLPSSVLHADEVPVVYVYRKAHCLPVQATGKSRTLVGRGMERTGGAALIGSAVLTFPNALVSQAMADALYYATDHLPLVASITFYNSVNVNEPTKQQRQLIAYPNPSNGVFTVVLPSGPSLPWQMMDMHGRILRKGSNQDTITFDLSSEACGTYLLQTQHEGLPRTVKLMLK